VAGEPALLVALLGLGGVLSLLAALLLSALLISSSVLIVS